MDRNVFVNGEWYGPSYPDAGEPPAGSVATPRTFEDDDELDDSDQGTAPVSQPSASVTNPPESTGEGDPPPRAGPGSSRQKWLEYADARGVRMRDDASREDIIAACEAAGVRTG